MGDWSVEVTIDAVDAEQVARFWQEALGYRLLYVRAPYVVLGPDQERPGAPRVLVQRVAARPHASGGMGQRVHLDLRVPEPAREVERLLDLGATLRDEIDERARGGSRWWVLADPEGSVFCVCPSR